MTKDQAIPKAIAEAAFASLDKEIGRKKNEGALEAGISSSVKLEWTPEAREAFRALEAVCANVESNSQSLETDTISLWILQLSGSSVATQRAPSSLVVHWYIRTLSSLSPCGIPAQH